jgi:hypothetical protein
MSKDKTMIRRLRRVIYWIACGLSVFVAGASIFMAFTDKGPGNAVLWGLGTLGAFFVLALLWGAGRAVVYIDTGK